MTAVYLPYVDSALDHLKNGGPPSYWRHLHWGLYDDPATEDDSPEGYFAAAEALTRHVLAAAGVADDRDVLDVGCGFGGTLDYLRAHHGGHRLVGVNIDHRQLRWAQRLSAEGNGAPRVPVSFVTADGCSLPVAGGAFDHVLAVECIFHFPSRKAFFREAARVLRPGGTLALSDFLVAPGATAKLATTAEALGPGDWYGHSARPITSAGYERIARAAGFEPVLDDDVTARTLPTYRGRRRLYRDSGATEGVATLDRIEVLAREGGWEYHVLAFRRHA